MAGHLLRRIVFLGEFNWPFLVFTLIFGLVAVLFLFYFNRLIAFALFGAIRSYTWLVYKIHVRCQAIQVSLLGGRIFLRGLEYCGENETIIVHQAYITWRYWYRRVADVNVRTTKLDTAEEPGPDTNDRAAPHTKEKTDNADAESGQKTSGTQAPCRVSVHIRGIEWFVYNRTPSFDAILAAFAQKMPKDHESVHRGESAQAKRSSGLERNGNSHNDSARESLQSAGYAARPPYQSFVEKPRGDVPLFLKLFPVSVECTKAAMVMGNQHTRSVMVAKIDRAEGQITAGPSGIYDKYRQHFCFDFVNPVLRFSPNQDYVEPLLSAGARASGVDNGAMHNDREHDRKHDRKKTRHRAREAIAKMVPQFARSVQSLARHSGSVQRDNDNTILDSTQPGDTHWMGLTRYLDEEEEDKLEHERWRRIEYAEEQVIADCPHATMDFYWDVPGSVPFGRTDEINDQRVEKACEVNGSEPPKWGLELHIGGGNVNYGPWADRQRIDLMTMFFPSAYTDAVSALPLAPGQTRVSTVFNIAIILDDKVTLRLHTREASKDWKFKSADNSNTRDSRSKDKRRQTKSKKQVQVAVDPSDRPAGWLDVAFEANTTVSYDMDMMAKKAGFTNNLSLDVVSPIITSSVNSDIFLKAASVIVGCDLSNPLSWNAKRTWKFDVSFREFELFMLREHAFAIQDLVEDFTTGPAAEFYTFIPFHYTIGLDFDKISIFLNANDLNIIDKPTDFNDNSFLILESQKVVAAVGIPADQLNPVKNRISFEGNLTDTAFRASLPTYNTYKTLLQDSCLGTFPSITVEGSYNYFSSTASDLTDTLLMQVHGDHPKLQLYGFLIRLFMTFRENYFGEDVHFQTIEEYQGRLQLPGRKHAADNDHKPTQQSNDLDVILSITTQNPCIILPSKMYSSEDSIKLDMESGCADLRFTNYYMDLQTTLSPISLSHVVSKFARPSRDANDIGVQTFIDGVSIVGHRLFGLPPSEPTYVCNWDFDVGAVTGEASVEYLGALIAGVQCLIYSLDDHENALPLQETTPLNDVTFIRASTQPIRLWLHVDQLAMLCEIDSSRVEFNDWARHRFSEKLHVVIPNIVLAAVDGQVATRRRTRMVAEEKGLTYGYLQSSLDVRMVSSKADFRETRRKQQDHIRLHDSRTSRTPWLLRETDAMNMSQHQTQLSKLQPPASPFPVMPAPLPHNDGSRINSTSLSLAQSLKANGTPDQRFDLVENTHYLASTKQDQQSSVNTERVSAEIFSQTTAPSSKSSFFSNQGQAFKAPAPGGMAMNMTFSSSYQQPYFPLIYILPNDEDVPHLNVKPTVTAGDRAGDVSADELPLEDDEMEHMTLMIAFDTGLRVMCTPPALRGVNALLGTIQSQEPGSLLDTLQMQSLGEITSKKKQLHVPKITQVRLQLPGLAFRFRHHVPSQLNRGERQQTYEIGVSDLLAIARFGAERGEPFGKTPTSMQLSLEQVELEACRTTHDSTDEARVLAKLTDLTSWLYEAEETTGNIQFRKLETASLNQRIEHLANLVNSAGTLANKLGQEFGATIACQSARLRYLVHVLSEGGKTIGDPSILSSASFVSRRWEEVVRTSDSWKMIMRLRWTLHKMDTSLAYRLRKELSKTTFSLPADALSQLIDSFTDWRAWDLENIRASSLVNALYGSSTPAHHDKTRKRAKPIEFTFVSEVISLVIDPGKRRNKVIITGLTARLKSDLQMSGIDTSGNAADHLIRKSTIEVSCQRSLFELKLDLLDAVKDIFAHVKGIEATQKAPVVSPGKVSDDGFVEQQLHVVMVVNRHDVRIRTKHLKIILGCMQFGGSVAALMRASDDILATALLTAHSSTVKVRAAVKDMVSIVLKGASLYGNLQSRPGLASLDNRWKVGAQCQKIELDVLDSALGLLGVADQVIGQELLYLRGVIQEMETANELRPIAEASSVPTKNTLQLTFQLEAYRITAILFSSLRYQLEGKHARSSFMPDLSDEAAHIFDFDVPGHAHSLFNTEGNGIYEVSRLALPPINGKVSLKQTEELAIRVEVEISKIALDAAAVHGLFTTFSRTELMSFGENVMRDVDIVKSNYHVAVSGIASPTSPRSPGSMRKFESPSKPVKYSARVGLAGIAVLATSSNSLKTSAELTVDSGPISFAIRNSHPNTSGLLAFPELDVRLNRIGVLLESLQNDQRDRCGSVTLSISLTGTSEVSDSNQVVRAYRAVVERFDVDIYTETASMIIDILGYLQQRFKSFNLSEELHTFRARRRRRAKSYIKAGEITSAPAGLDEDLPVALFDAIFNFQLRRLQVVWHVEGQLRSPAEVPENLVFSVENIDLHTKKGNTARLEIKNLQLQMVGLSQPPTERSKNSALLPEVVFKVAYLSRSKDRRLAIQAIGKALDLRVTSQFILPAVNIQRSIAVATQDLRKVLSDWNETLVQGDSQQKSVLGEKTLSSLAIDADFAGAVVYMEGREITDTARNFVGNRGIRAPREGKYGQFAQANSRSTTTLRSPGLAFRVEYSDTSEAGRHLNGELKIDASKNELQPMFVPLVLEIMASIKDIVGDSSQGSSKEAGIGKQSLDMSTLTDGNTDPSTILGDCKLNLGLRICEQSFSLTCKPIAQVTATSRFKDIYITVSTVQPPNQERFFSVSSAITGLETTVQHVYSRESTGRFQIDSIHLSLMNSKHFSGMTGISSILNISPMKVFLNVKQLQDFLLFREIWYPVEIRPVPQAPSSASTTPIRGGVQRYQQATATNAFSWNAAIHIAALELSLDLGQAVGKLSFSINRLWITSRKDSEREQNLCLGFESIGMDSVGRMSGSVQLRNMRVRTNIVWAEAGDAAQTPLVQASLGFDDLRAKTSFDYQTFAVADFQTLTFLLYNVTEPGRDRLVCAVNGDKIQAYCTANAAAQAVALYQAINRLIEEKQAAFQTSLKEMEKFQRQKAAAGLGISSSQELSRSIVEEAQVELTPVRLQVNVDVSLNALRAGVYPRAFRDAQIFKLEALDALARFSVNVSEDNKIHTLLTVVLGQLRVALSSVERTSLRPKPLGDDVSIDNVVKDSTASRGGTILRVPRVVATMQTWQVQASKNVEYIFKSTFEGKVEVGWNYSRISFIRGMWDMHSKALVQRLGKLPQSAVQITSSPRPDAERTSESDEAQEKITAVVNVPVSKYVYEAREPPVIQTPQLRDMGEATPPLEWIGLQRDKLPNLTHQVVIVPLLEFSKEVEDAYGKILGAS